MTVNTQTEATSPAGSDEAQPEAAQANQATSESTDVWSHFPSRQAGRLA